MKSGNLKRRILAGASTTVGTLVFLGIIIAIQYIILQHPVRWDVTNTGRFTLSEQSRKVLDTFRNQGTPVDVLAFYETQNVGNRELARDLLDQYRDAYGEFRYTFVDPDRDAALAKANKVDSYPTLIFKAHDKTERVANADEEAVTNALVKLLRTERKKVYLLKGHGERAPTSTEPTGFKTAVEHIEKQNYQTTELTLMQDGEVPKDAAILIIAGPKTDLMDSEVEALKDYLARGGSLFVLVDPFKAPKLCATLKTYGFETKEDIVVDRMSKALGGDYLMPMITTYIDFPITKNFTLASFFPEARSVAVPQKPGPGLEAQELALTSPVSWTISKEQLDSGKANFDEKVGKKGPISVMAVATSVDPEATMKPAEQDPKADDKKTGPEAPAKPKKARIVVSGSSLFAANKFFGLQGNGDLFMNTVSWLAEDENLIAIRPKSARAQPVILTPRDTVLVVFVSVVLAPFAWALAGVFVYLYRRRAVVA